MASVPDAAPRQLLEQARHEIETLYVAMLAASRANTLPQGAKGVPGGVTASAGEALEAAQRDLAAATARIEALQSKLSDTEGKYAKEREAAAAAHAVETERCGVVASERCAPSLCLCCLCLCCYKRGLCLNPVLWSWHCCVHLQQATLGGGASQG